MSAGAPAVPVPQEDVECGLMVYSTGGVRHEGRLRARTNDFQVEELISLEDLAQQRAPGLVPVYRVTKSGEDTPHVAREIAAVIKSEVNFAGLKDKKAEVVQYVSARSTRALSPTQVRGARFEAQLVGFSRPVTRAMLRGNRFRIFVETLEEISSEIEACFRMCQGRKIANFFGYQRFGLRGGINRRVGRALVERDFAAATGLILSRPRDGEDEDVLEARRFCAEGRYDQALRLFSPRQDVERAVASQLSRKPGDHIGALRKIPIAIRRLLVNSYQAYVFNLVLSRAIEEEVDISIAETGDNWASLEEGGLTVGRVHGVKEDVPAERGVCVPLIQMVGYAYRDYGSRFDGLLAEIIENEGISPGSFYIKEAEEMSNEGGFRPAPLLCRDLSFQREEEDDREGGEEGRDGRRRGKGFALEFTLGKGEYATVLLRELMKPARPHLMGF